MRVIRAYNIARLLLFYDDEYHYDVGALAKSNAYHRNHPIDLTITSLSFASSSSSSFAKEAMKKRGNTQLGSEHEEALALEILRQQVCLRFIL